MEGQVGRLASWGLRGWEISDGLQDGGCERILAHAASMALFSKSMEEISACSIWPNCFRHQVWTCHLLQNAGELGLILLIAQKEIVFSNRRCDQIWSVIKSVEPDKRTQLVLHNSLSHD